MIPKITPFDIVKIKKVRQGYIVIPRWDFKELYIEEKPQQKRKR